MSYITDGRVDLTEDRDFRDPTERWFSLGSFIDLADNNFISWLRTDPRDEFPTGTKEQIINSLEILRLYDGPKCARCGVNITPWTEEETGGLCIRCNQELEDELYGQYPWSRTEARNIIEEEDING